MVREIIAILSAAVLAPIALADSPRVEVSRDVHHDISPAVRDLPKIAPTARPPHIIPLHKRPPSAAPTAAPSAQVDTAVQAQAPTPLAATTGFDLLGVGQGFKGPQGTFSVNSVPPDTNGAVGDTQVVELVNTGFAVFNKSTGAIISGPIDTRSLWGGFGGGCQNNDDGDGIVVFDRVSHRWIISQFSVSTTPYLECVAVSATNDATGKFYRYAFKQPYFNDYPKLGVWPDAYYATYNLFKGSTYVGPRACAMNRTAMLTGASAIQECFTLSSLYFTLLPANVDGATAPPAGSPNYMISLGAGDLLEWSFHADFTTPTNATLKGPVAINVAAFTTPCGASGVCIPQKGTTQKLDSLSDRLMQRLAYRNFAAATPAHESLVVTHTVKTSTGTTALRWYEIRSPHASPAVYQQGTYAPDSVYRWAGSTAMDKVGNLLIGYSASDALLHPSVRITGRLATDPLGALEAETIVFTGNGSQTGGGSGRWGDYSGLSLDPTDDCTFWYFNEYYPANGVFNWATRAISAKFSNCS